MTEPNPNTVEGFKELMRVSEYRARCYIQGSRYHDKLKSIQPVAGEWSVHFRNHPRVIEAEREGFSRELRAAVVAECKRRLINGQDFGEPDDLMPRDAKWWEHTKENAVRFKAGTEWQRENMAAEQADAHKGAPQRVDRDAWRSRHERRRPLLGMKANEILSDLSKRMTGEAAGE